MILSILKQLLILAGIFIVVYVYYQRYDPVPTIHDFVVFEDRYFKVERSTVPESNTRDMKEVLKSHVRSVRTDSSKND